MEADVAEYMASTVHERNKGNQTWENECINFLNLMYELAQVFSDHFDSIHKGQAPFPACVLFV